MKELSAKQEAFYLKWEQQRKKKWLYVFVHGIIYYGNPSGEKNGAHKLPVYHGEDEQGIRWKA